ncbi:hypothetical protein B0H19DRAFT_1062586 [Mycena capillaripes]|nr:hypothetical protein B0H19DRAFT_1062586 [Mycena capillaripes]
MASTSKSSTGADIHLHLRACQVAGTTPTSTSASTSAPSTKSQKKNIRKQESAKEGSKEKYNNNTSALPPPAWLQDHCPNCFALTCTQEGYRLQPKKGKPSEGDGHGHSRPIALPPFKAHHGHGGPGAKRLPKLATVTVPLAPSCHPQPLGHVTVGQPSPPYRLVQYPCPSP